MYFLKSHQRKFETNKTQDKEEPVDKIFCKMDVLRKWELVTLFCYVHNKKSFFLFSLKLKISFFVGLAPFFTF